MLRQLLVIAFLGLLTTAPVLAQFPPDLLPPSRAELGDTATAIRADFAAGDSGKADTTDVKTLESRADSDSLRIDTLELRADLDSTRLDSVKYFYGVAGDTTSPGLAYYLKSDDLWYRADTSIAVIARGIAVDSVNKGAVCRFQRIGLLTISWYNFPTAGLKVVNDSVTAGAISVADSLRTNTKKMQTYGWTTTDSTTLNIEISPVHWVWE